MRLMKLVARIYDLPNAYRVLDIMDEAGCDIEKVDRPGFENSGYWRIDPKWYVSEKDANDLQRIVLHKSNYKQRSKIWKHVFVGYRFDEAYQPRILKDWPVRFPIPCKILNVYWNCVDEITFPFRKMAAKLRRGGSL